MLYFYFSLFCLLYVYEYFAYLSVCDLGAVPLEARRRLNGIGALTTFPEYFYCCMNCAFIVT